MPSFKIRRSIGISNELALALEAASGGRKVSAFANKIILGELGPVPEPKTSSSGKFISMRESLFLSIQTRADKIGETARSTFRGLLTGRLPPLEKGEIAAGIELAKTREMLRAEREFADRKVVEACFGEAPPSSGKSSAPLVNSESGQHFGGVHYF